jgi:hypothetical protein
MNRSRGSADIGSATTSVRAGAVTVGPTGPIGTFTAAAGGSTRVFGGATGLTSAASASFSGSGSFGLPTGPSGPPYPVGSADGKTTTVEVVRGLEPVRTRGGRKRKRRAVVPERFVRAHFALSTAPPEVALKLLPFIVSRKLRDAVEGDLAEEFRKHAARRGRPYALGVLWWDIAGLCICRLGPTAIITAIAASCRQKLGW